MRPARRWMLVAALTASVSAAGAAPAADIDIRPAPSKAGRDRSQAYRDGCLVPKSALTSPACVYGDRSSDVTVVLLGDSHAMQYFPALRSIAGERGWRLVELTKSGCPPAAVLIPRRGRGRPYHECTEWRRAALARIADREQPQLVITSSATHYRVLKGGTKLAGLPRLQALAAGYVSVVRRLLDGGAAVVAISDGPRPPFDVPSCVARNLRDPGRCAFARSPAVERSRVITRALGRVAALTQVDPAARICRGKTCPAVIARVLVYRQGAHLTATFVRTLTRWLDAQIPAVRGR
jgi:SGNH domain-containing protein